MLPLLLAVSLAAVISQTSQAAAQTPTPLCENGTAVPSPAANPGLVADCSALLTAKDTLRGTATLNWDADTAITSLGRHHARRHTPARDEAAADL